MPVGARAQSAILLSCFRLMVCSRLVTDLFTVRHVFGGICGSYGIWNPGYGNLSNTHLL